MAIGDQTIGDTTVSEHDLRKIYEDLIKVALLRADPSLEIIRADEVAAQGTITTDILTRLMHADIVVADITYANPNVFYELGIRHACRSGTIILRDNSAAVYAPFDVSHQRYISYDNTPSGLKSLAGQLSERLTWYATAPTTDNHLLEHAKNSKFNFPQFGEETTLRREEGIKDLIEAIIESDELIDALLSSLGDRTDIPPVLLPMIAGLRKNPAAAGKIISAFIKMGVLDPARLLK